MRRAATIGRIASAISIALLMLVACRPSPPPDASAAGEKPGANTVADPADDDRSGHNEARGRSAGYWIGVAQKPTRLDSKSLSFNETSMPQHFDSRGRAIRASASWI